MTTGRSLISLAFENYVLFANKPQHGQPQFDSSMTCSFWIVKMQSKLVWSDIIDGAGYFTTDELAGGARINFIFHDTFGNALAQVNPLDGIG